MSCVPLFIIYNFFHPNDLSIPLLKYYLFEYGHEICISTLTHLHTSTMVCNVFCKKKKKKKYLGTQSIHQTLQAKLYYFSSYYLLLFIFPSLFQASVLNYTAFNLRCFLFPLCCHIPHTTTVLAEICKTGFFPH